MQNGHASATLSANNTLIVQEPLYVSAVVTFGIEGECILNEMMVNASIDDIISMCMF